MEIKDSPSSKTKIRVMADSKHKRQLFNECKNDKVPVVFDQLSPVKSGKRFFNPNMGGSFSTLDKIDFEYDDNKDLSVADLLDSPPTGLFSVVGEIRWMEFPRDITTRGHVKSVREGMFIDSSETPIDISVWGSNLIVEIKEGTTYQLSDLTLSHWKEKTRLSSTFTTKVTTLPKQLFNWGNDQLKTIQRICCPEVLAAKLDMYIECRNLACRKKILLPSDTAESKFTYCNHCKRTMLISKCNQMFNIDITILDKERHLSVTIFPEIAKEYLLVEKPEDILSGLLELEDTDITIDKKRIVTKLQKHEDLD